MTTFYEQQESARSSSSGMLLILSMAIAVTTVLTGLMITLWIFVPLYWLFIRRYAEAELSNEIHVFPQERGPVEALLYDYLPGMEAFPWELLAFFFVVISVSTAAVLISVTRARMQRLREAGGVGVAEALGGVCISSANYHGDQNSRRAVNIVQELAIAARISPPQVYLLHDEPGINAFAVGLTSRDLVIGLTAGALRELNREQLQAVVAHEFAHIANGDTRTNLLLVGYLHGLMGIVIAAQSLIHNGFELLVKSISHGGQGVTGIFIVAIGVLLWPVGLAGLIAATIVKAAYSRQREYLADASAIEFTRNDAGLLGAWRRILGSSQGSRVRSPQSLSLSHAFFAKSCGGLFGLLDSHPRIEKRILAIDAGWDGQPLFEEEHEVAPFDGSIFGGTMSIAQQARESSCGRLAASDSAALRCGTPVLAHETTMEVMEHATEVRATIPEDLWSLTQERATAEAIVFALWAGGQLETTHDDEELTALGATCAASQKVADALLPHLQLYGLPQRLMLFDAAVNLLRAEADAGQLHRFCRNAEALLTADEDHDLLRWCWKKTLTQLVRRAQRGPLPKPKFAGVGEVRDECAVLLSALAYANGSPLMLELALRRGANLLGEELGLLPQDACGLAAIDQSLEVLQLLAPKARQKLVLACSKCVESDTEMTEDETLLMRGICSGLGYPPATLLPGQPVALN